MSYAVTISVLQQELADFRHTVALSIGGEVDWVSISKQHLMSYQQNPHPLEIDSSIRQLLLCIDYPAGRLIHTLPPGRDRSVFLSLQSDNHPLLNPLLTLEHSIDDFVKTLSDDESLALLKLSLCQLVEYYKAFRKKLVRSSQEECLQLFDDISRFCFPGSQSYDVFSKRARAIRNLTEYGSQVNPPSPGSNHVAIPDSDFYFKGDTSFVKLNPELETAIYAWHRFFFQERDITPSSLLILQDVPILQSRDSKVQGRFNLEVIATPQQKTPAQYFTENPGENRTFQPTYQFYALQVSQEVKGMRLDKYLASTPDPLVHIDRKSFSMLVLGSLLTRQGDYKPENIMVTTDLKLVGIDNDCVFQPVLRCLRNGKELGLKNILYFFKPLMDSPIHPEVVEEFVQYPTIKLLQWAGFCQQQKRLYDDLAQQGVLTSELCSKIHFPFHLRPDILALLHRDICMVVRRLTDNPSLTHQDVFKWLYPAVWHCYQCIQAHEVDPQKSLEKLWHQSLDEVVGLSPQIEGRSLSEWMRQEIESSSNESDLTYLVEQEGVHWQQEVESIVHSLHFDEIQQCPSDVWADLLEALYISFGENIFSQLKWQEFTVQAGDESVFEENFIIKALQGNIAGSTLKSLLQSCNIIHSARSLDFILAQSTPQSQEQLNTLLSCIPFDEPISQKMTLFNWTMHHHHYQLIPVLVEQNNAMDTADPSIALKCYTRLQTLQRTTPSPLYQKALEALVKLQQHHPKVRWYITMEDILSQASESLSLSDYFDSGCYPICGSHLGQHILENDYAQQLFDGQRLRPGVGGGNHRVIRVQTHHNLLPSALYFKFLTEWNHTEAKNVGALPGMEEAVGCLIRSMVPYGAPYTELFNIALPKGQSLPVLVSQAVEGETLSKTLSDHAERLQLLEPKSLSQLLLATMLLNPEDGKRDNYIVIPSCIDPSQYQIVCIDNERAFVPPIAQEQAKIVVCAKSVLFCLDQMHERVHPEVIKQWLQTDPLKFLENWLHEAKKIHDRQRSLWNSCKLASFESSHGIRVGVLLKKGAMGYLYNKILRLQRVLDVSQSPTHLDVLKAVEPLLHHRYSRVLQQPITISKRFEEADGAFFQYVKGTERTMSSVAQIIKECGIPYGREEYGPTSALEEVKEMQQKVLKQQKIEQGIMDIVDDIQLEEALRRVNFREMKLPDQVNLLKSLQERQLRHITLSLIRTSLWNSFFKDNRHVCHLVELDLTECDVTSDVFVTLQRATLLEKLSVRKSINMEKLEQDNGLFKSNTPLEFPHVKILRLEKCASLKKISIRVPELEDLYLNKCAALQEINIQAPSLHIWELEGCSELRKLLCPNAQHLQQINLRGLSDPKRLLFLTAIFEGGCRNTDILSTPDGVEALVLKTTQSSPKATQVLTDLLRNDHACAGVFQSLCTIYEKFNNKTQRSVIINLFRSLLGEITGEKRQIVVQSLETLAKSKKTDEKEQKAIHADLDELKKGLPIKKACVMGLYMYHYPDIRKALFKQSNNHVDIVIGVNFSQLIDSDTKFQFWELPEHESFRSIARSYYRGASAFIFHFGNSFCGEGGKLCDLSVINMYSDEISNNADLRTFPKILLGVGDGHIGDLAEILKLKEKALIDTLIYLPWSKKPYQQAYIRNKVCAIIRQDSHQVNEVEEQYEEKKKQEKEILCRLAVKLQVETIDIVELFKHLSDVDYSDLFELLQDLLSILSKEKNALDSSSSFIMNIKHLFYLGMIEYNRKIIDWLAPIVVPQGSQECFLLEGTLIKKVVNYLPNATLCRACVSGFLPAVQYLVQKDRGSLLEESDGRGDYPGNLTPVAYATQNGHIHIIQWLIENNYLSTPLKNAVLFESAKQGYKNIVEYILVQDAEINCQNSKGETPLYFAASKGHKQLSRFLLMKGASRQCTIEVYDSKAQTHNKKTIDIVKTFSIEEDDNTSASKT